MVDSHGVVQHAVEGVGIYLETRQKAPVFQQADKTIQVVWKQNS